MRFVVKKRSMLNKILWPVLILVIVQSALFASAMLWGGTVNLMKENSLGILTERVTNRKNNFENEMLTRWSNLSETEADVSSQINTVLRQNDGSYQDLTAGSELSVKVIDSVADDLVYMLRKSGVTGAFLVLCGDDYQRPPHNATTDKSGFYVRDMDPMSTPSDKTDLLLERAPSAVAQRLGITTDIYWSPIFNLSIDDDYYFKPLHAAIAHPELSSKNLGYWGGVMRLHPNDLPVLTYSLPLKTNDGRIFGVLGIEMTVDYLQRLLPYSELSPDNLGSYILAVDTADDRNTMYFAPQASSGPMYKYNFGSAEQLHFTDVPKYRNIYATDSVGNEKVLASVQRLRLYNSNTPFANDEWVLVGMESEKDLFAFSANMTATIGTIFILSLMLGILGAGFIAVSVTKPVTTLARKVRESDPHLPVVLPSIKVAEIDQLSGAIEQMSQDVARTSSRISTIIDLSGMQVGVFEHTYNEELVHCSVGFFALTDLPEQNNSISYSDFAVFMDDLYSRAEQPCAKELFVSYIRLNNGKLQYLRVRIKHDDNALLGVIMDVTQEIAEKRKIEYERDNDLLTSLLNRRAFARRTADLFNNKQCLKKAALLMMDLDNLKYVNDTYGHDCGDEYIRCAANVLRGLTDERVLCARMSGDEFQVLFYGFDTQDEIRELIDDIRRQMLSSKMTLPDGQIYKVRASAGVAWYPRDADTVERLTRYADFAMYEVKNSVKGDIKDFDAAIYRRDSFLLHSKEELNCMVDEELVDYAFQPIVTVATGEVFAYEALMRPRLATLKNPLEVMRLAHSQSMLYQIERLTWFCAMASVRAQTQSLGHATVFINSISNQLLNEADLAEFTRLYADYFPSLVIELTESEHADTEYTEKKLALLRNMHLPIALDDFGSGYNSDMALLELKPDYVKIDMGIVRGIDKDTKRQEIFANLVSFSKQNGIKVIAEGVETEAEMRVLVRGGADYLQGYYFGKPNLTPQSAEPAAVHTLLHP